MFLSPSHDPTTDFHLLVSSLLIYHKPVACCASVILQVLTQLNICMMPDAAFYSHHQEKKTTSQFVSNAVDQSSSY